MNRSAIDILFIDSNTIRRKKNMASFSNASLFYLNFKSFQIKTDKAKIVTPDLFSIVFIHYADFRFLPEEYKGKMRIWYSGKKGLKKDIPVNENQFIKTVMKDQPITNKEADSIIEYWKGIAAKPSFLVNLADNKEAATGFLFTLLNPQKINWTEIKLPEDLLQHEMHWDYFFREVSKIKKPISLNQSEYIELYNEFRNTLLNEA